MTAIRFELTGSKDYCDAMSFGEIGSYQQIDGIMHFAVNPEDSANSNIIDLDLAPRNESGRVLFAADISILTPTDPDKSNRRLLVDVVNRGNKLVASNFHRVPALTAEDRDKPGDGFLYQSGYTIVSVGWQWDAQGEGSLALDPPWALIDGKPIQGQTISEFRPDKDQKVLPLIQLNQTRPSYPVININSDTNLLYVKDYEDGPAELVPSEDWQFAMESTAGVVASDRHLHMDKGFQKGRIYQLVYLTEGAPVVGSGMLALRDVATCLRFNDQPSPLTNGFDKVYAFGVSQTGRVLRHFLYEGLNRDETQRIAYDAMLIHIAGGQRGDFNHRFAQPTVATVPGFGQRFPFAVTDSTDPFATPAELTAGGATDSLFSKLEKLDAVPKVFFTNTSWEYWRGDASLIHTDMIANEDLEEHSATRNYHFAGTHHMGGLLINGQQIKTIPDLLEAEHGLNVVNFSALLRAALVNLDNWVSSDVDPPVSRHPRLDDGTAVSRFEVLEKFSRLPAIQRLDPEKLSVIRKMDLGEREKQGVGRYPVQESHIYPAAVSAVDDDLNELAGIRLPDITVPVGTHTGWNPRSAKTGAPMLAAIFAGFSAFFCNTKVERTEAGDPRLSLEERYASEEAYLRLVESHTAQLIADGYVLEEDEAWLINCALQRYQAALDSHD